MSKLLKLSQTTRVLTFLMTDSSDHIAAKTGLAPTVVLSKNGAAFGSPAGAVTEIGNGWYQVAGNATDANTLGPLILHASATGADPTDSQYQVVAFDPMDGTALGLADLDAAISSRSTYAGGAVASVTAGVTLASAEHTNIATDAQTGLTAQGYTPTRAGYLDALNGLVAAVWAAAGRTLTAFGFTPTVGGYASGQAPPLATDYTPARATKLDNLDATVSSRNSVVPDNTSIGTILTRTDVATSTRQATLTLPSNFAALLIDPIGRVTFVPGEDTPIQADVVAALTTQGLTTGRAALLDRLDAAVSTRLAASGYTAPLSTGGTANAVWDALTSAHTTAGSTGAALTAAGASADPMLNAVPGSYPAGSAGYTLGRLLVGQVTLVSPVLAGGALDLYAGAAYTAGGGNAPVWVLPSTVPDLAGATVTWHANDGSAAQPVAVSGPRSAQILTLPLDPNPVGVGHYWRWEICATGGSLGTAHPVVVLAGTLTVHPLP